MPRLRNSLGLKVLWAYLAGVAFSVLLISLGGLMLVSFRGEVLDMRLAEQAKDLSQRLEFNDQGLPTALRPSEQQVDWIYDSLQDELAYRVLDASGRAVLHSPAGPAFWPPLAATPTESAANGFSFKRGEADIHVETHAVHRASRTWYVQYAGSTRMADLFQVEFALPLIGKVILLFSLILLVVFGACSYVILWRAFRPLRSLSAAAMAISPRSLDARLSEAGVPSEVAPLVDGFNRALDRLEHGYRVQREFLASAAHELKTPLALIRAQVELGDRTPDRDSLLQDVEHMTRQVQQLLLLAEASEATNYSFGPVSVLDLAKDVAGYLQRIAQAAAVQIEVFEKLPAPMWMADRNAFFTLLKNLVENAIQHSPPGATISIGADEWTLTVRDWGSGATEAQVSQMFTRFWRGAHRRDVGAGLGLAICMEVAQTHGWALRARRMDPGLRFELQRSPQAPTTHPAAG